MRLATVRFDGSTRAVRFAGHVVVELDAVDVGALLAGDDWERVARSAGGREHPVDGLDYAPLIVDPDKVICVGMFEHTTPLGPWLVTPDEAPGPDRVISCDVNGERMQEADTGDLVFDPVTLVEYISSIITLEPGDVIATGTPGGVGAARTPPRFLRNGDEVVTRIEGIGVCRNTCRC